MTSLSTLTETLFVCVVLLDDFGNKRSIASAETNVDAIIKKIKSKNTISVIDDMLNSGVTLFLPLNRILAWFV